MSPRRQRVSLRFCASPPLRNRLADAVRKDVVKIEVELDNAAIAVPGEPVRQNDRLCPDLEIRAGPDDPGLDRAKRLIRWRPADRSAERNLHQRNQLIERRAK